MEEERPVKDAREALNKESQGTTVVSGEETIVSQKNVEVSAEGEESSTDNGSDSGLSKKQTWLVIASIVVVLILIIVGLFLPPISLGERLGLGSDESEMVEVETADGTTTSVEGFSLILADESARVKSETIDQVEFLSGGAGGEWSAALQAIPANLNLASDLFSLEYKDEAPLGSAQIAVPSAAQPYQTLDLYGWNGQQWQFIASQVGEGGNMVSTAAMPLPRALALMQTSKPAEPEIGAEVLPAQVLPVEVLPYLSEVTAGTLTLGQNGQLLGDVVAVPSGGYRQFLRATNTGVIVDSESLNAMLGDPAAQQTNIQTLVDKAYGGGFAGINLDYQGVPAGQKAAFTSFVNDLAAALHGENLELMLTLETPVLLDGTWDTAGQDWSALEKIADVIYLQLPLNPTAYSEGGVAQTILEMATRQINRAKLSALISVNAVDEVGDARLEIESSKALANFGELEFVQGGPEVEPGQTIQVALSGSAGDLEWDPDGLTYKYTYEQANQPHQVWLGSEAILSNQGRFANSYNVRGLAVRGLGYLDQGEGYAVALENYLGAGEAPQPASAAIVWAVEDESGGVVASSSGSDLAFSWEGSDAPGKYLVRADFAHGESIASLGEVEVVVKDKEEPTPTPEPSPTAEQAVAAATTIAGPSNVNPGDADAAVNTPANMRSGPGLNYGIIGGIQPGEKVSLIGRNADSTWLQVELADGTEGWIFAQLLTVNSSVSVSSLAVVEVEPPAVASGGSPPPVIAPAAGGNFELGGQTHTLANPTLMNMAGMNWVKFQHKWGSGDTPDSVTGRIQQAHANGFKVLLSIPGASSYPGSIDFNGYVQFLRGVAAAGPDAIEVWNEENIDFEWPAGQIDPASYVNNMLAPAYNAIKSANPSVMVISGAPAPTGFHNGTNAWSDDRYMAGVAAAGGANYMDCIGVHHNAGATSPSVASGHPAGNNHYSWYFGPTLNMYYNAFGGSRPVCFTELGYLSGDDYGGVPSRFSWAAGTSIAEHAQWLAEAASLSANSGKVRLMIVFNVDFTHWSEDPQAGYAMLRKDGSCPSCTLLGQVMGR